MKKLIYKYINKYFDEQALDIIKTRMCARGFIINVIEEDKYYNIYYNYYFDERKEDRLLTKIVKNDGINFFCFVDKDKYIETLLKRIERIEK